MTRISKVANPNFRSANHAPPDFLKIENAPSKFQQWKPLNFEHLSDGIRLKSIKLTLNMQIMQNSRVQSCAGDTPIMQNRCVQNWIGSDQPQPKLAPAKLKLSVLPTRGIFPWSDCPVLVSHKGVMNWNALTEQFVRSAMINRIAIPSRLPTVFLKVQPDKLTDRSELHRCNHINIDLVSSYGKHTKHNHINIIDLLPGVFL